ncbi:MAG TPA: hypothetical protein PKI32_04080, partial [Opitutales bacterium]|nr:hypothetical protein [Opitutales bacterium]
LGVHTHGVIIPNIPARGQENYHRAATAFRKSRKVCALSHEPPSNPAAFQLRFFHTRFRNKN